MNLSKRQLDALRLLAAGERVRGYRIGTRAFHPSTINSLISAGLVDAFGKITENGRRELVESEEQTT